MTVEHGSSLDSTESAIDGAEIPHADRMDGHRLARDRHACTGWQRFGAGPAGVWQGGV